MGALSDTDAANLLNAKFGGGSFSTPATFYVALSSTEPNDDGTGVTEPSGTAYARVAVTRNSTNFPTTTTRTISNGTAITFATPGAGDDWGVLQWWALYDASSGGTMRCWGVFATSIHVLDGGTAPSIPAGAMVIAAPGSP